MTASNDIAGGVDYAEAARIMFNACPDRFMRVEQCYPAIDALRTAGFLAAPVEVDARVEAMRSALDRLVNCKALAEVRRIVAGWNGEEREDGPYERHPVRLGATIKTNCGQMYALDEAMVAARAALQPAQPTGDGA